MRSLLLLSLSMLSFACAAQHAFLSKFNATAVGNGVFLEWTLTAGNTCQGIDIERAAIGKEFIQIGHIEGICGSLDKAVDFSFLDGEPLIGQENRYRLLLGTSGYTDEISTNYFDVDANGYVLLHDRANDLVTIVSSGNVNTSKTIFLYASGGTKVRELTMTGAIQEENIADLRSGLYILFVFEDDQVAFTKKFVKSN